MRHAGYKWDLRTVNGLYNLVIFAWGEAEGMGQQASNRASATQMPTTTPSRGPSVVHRVRGGRPSPRRYMRVPKDKETEGRTMEIIDADEMVSR